MWRYTSLNDLMNIIKASTLATFFIIVLILYLNRFEGVSRSVFIIDWCFTIFFVLALRVVTRLYFEKFVGSDKVNLIDDLIRRIYRRKKQSQTEVIIIGAGGCGEKIAREIKDNSVIRYRVAGFLDDDLKKVGRKIHGISVMNTIDQLENVIKSTGATEVIIALPSASASRLRTIVEDCKSCEIKYKIVPNMGELINGKVTINSIRDVEYRD
ncbi:MAG: polysaccharide biosynthesis protein, partial [Proteobacteria bacterium]|nr:polysaccharide biosynthesis protein [Pseudomonadota bacterium]